ncbi:hypothetical protein M5K25_020057 [Dendrobium thyrsiflorum]|uniref:Uncharacterized protein n=1 Tax=Dendrobium thyrsiflorum TaxID=117978 RepID=A0ABD0U8Y4_DENTH
MYFELPAAVHFAGQVKPLKFERKRNTRNTGERNLAHLTMTTLPLRRYSLPVGLCSFDDVPCSSSPLQRHCLLVGLHPLDGVAFLLDFAPSSPHTVKVIFLPFVCFFAPSTMTFPVCVLLRPFYSADNLFSGRKTFALSLWDGLIEAVATKQLEPQEIHHLALKADGGGNDDRPNQDPMVLSSRAIIVVDPTWPKDPCRQQWIVSSKGFEIVEEHTRSNHDCNLMAPFGGKSPGQRVSVITIYMWCHLAAKQPIREHVPHPYWQETD